MSVVMNLQFALNLGVKTERERVKSLRDFDLKFYTFNNLKGTIFNGAFLVFQKYV